MLLQRQLTGQPGHLRAGHRWRGRNSPIGKDLRPHVNKPGHGYRVTIACRVQREIRTHAPDLLLLVDPAKPAARTTPCWLRPPARPPHRPAYRQSPAPRQAPQWMADRPGRRNHSRPRHPAIRRRRAQQPIRGTTRGATPPGPARWQRTAPLAGTARPNTKAAPASPGTGGTAPAGNCGEDATAVHVYGNFHCLFLPSYQARGWPPTPRRLGPTWEARHAARIRVRRIYDDPSLGDGVRVLVDRVWPRGVGGVNFSALVSRFVITWCIQCGSAAGSGRQPPVQSDSRCLESPGQAARLPWRRRRPGRSGARPVAGRRRRRRPASAGRRPCGPAAVFHRAARPARPGWVL